MLNDTLSPATIVRIYTLSVLRWALFGAIATYALLLGVFSWVGYTEGLTFSLLPVPGFFLVSMGVGAFIGGASGVEPAQEAAYAQEAALKRARALHPATRTEGVTPWGNPAWRPEHDDATDYDYW